MGRPASVAGVAKTMVRSLDPSLDRWVLTQTLHGVARSSIDTKYKFCVACEPWSGQPMMAWLKLRFVRRGFGVLYGYL
jgi:hypothetical protein